MRYHCLPIRLAKIKKTDIASIRAAGGRGAREPEVSYTAGGDVRWSDHFQKQFGSFLTSYKYILAIWLSHSTPRYSRKTNERIYPYKHLYAKVHSSFICNSQKLETTQTSNKL